MSKLMPAKALEIASSLSSLGFAVIIQFAVALIVARAVGKYDFGSFNIYAAAAVIGLECATFGTNDLLYRKFVDNPQDMPRFLFESIALSVVIAPVIAIIAFVLFDFGALAHLIFVLALSLEIVAQRIISLCEAVHISRSEVGLANRCRTVGAASRLIFVLLAYLVSSTDVRVFILFQLAGTVVAAIGLSVWAFRRIVWPARSGSRTIGRSIFAMGAAQVARGLQTQIDRLMISSFVGLGPLGVYSVASRLTAGAVIPIHAATRVMYMGYFKNSSLGARRLIAVSYKNIIVLYAISAMCYVALYIAAPFISQLAGPEYFESARVARIVGLTLFFIPLHFYCSDVLVAVGHASLKFASTLIGIIVTCLLIWTIANKDVFDASYALVAGSASSAIGSLIALLCIARKARPV